MKRILSLAIAVFMLSVFFTVEKAKASGFNTNLTGWEDIRGTWTVTDAGYKGPDGDNMLAASDKLVTAGKMFKYTATTNTSDGGLAIIADKSDPLKTWWCANISSSGSVLFFKMVRNNEGNYEVVMRADGSVAPSATYDLELSCDGNGVLTFKVNGVIGAVMTDTTLSGYLGLKLYYNSAVFNNVNYTEGSAFNSNMTGFTAANDSVWKMTSYGYESTTQSGKHVAKSDVVIDGTKSFIYEVSFLKYAGYGAGLAFNVVDGNNFFGIEINTNGEFYFPSLRQGNWSPWYDWGTNLSQEQRDAHEYTIKFEYNAANRSAKAYLNGVLMQTLNNISLETISGNLGLYNEETTVVYTKAMYTEIVPVETDFETNMEWTNLSGTWVLNESGYRNIQNGRGFAKSNIQIDGSNSFIYEVTAEYTSGYGFGFAFGLVDINNFSAIELNADGALLYPYKVNDTWNNYHDGQFEGKPAPGNVIAFRFVYDSEAKNAKLYVNGNLAMDIDNIDQDRIKGTLGLFTEDADGITFKKAVYTELIKSDFDTNLEGWEPAIEGGYALIKEGYQSKRPGRNLAKSGMVIDGTKSFVYEVTGSYQGYGFSIAFNAKDGDNFRGIELNGDGHFSFHKRDNGAYGNWVEGIVDMTQEQREASVYVFRFVYDAQKKSADVFLNGKLMKHIDNINTDDIKGNLGLFTEDANAVFTKVTYEELNESNPSTGDTGLMIYVSLLFAVLFLLVLIKKPVRI